MWAGHGATANAVSAPPNRNHAGIVVPANRPWIDTGIWIDANQIVEVEARGTIQFRSLGRGQSSKHVSVGPEGTFFWNDDVLGKAFSLPAADQGPAPAYCLIGKIGSDGNPFYLGAHRSWRSDRSGTLQLGINDYEFSDNTGSLQVSVSFPSRVRPVSFRQSISRDRSSGKPVSECSVVVFYIDGLRPDVVEEMAGMGHLPNFRHYFLEGGTRMANSVTVFPSNTITSNGTLWTGRFSDQHGIKSQTRFSRRLLEETPHLDPLGPNETAKILSPHGIDRFFFSLQSWGIRATRGDEYARWWQRSQTTETPAIYDYLRRQGADWAPGILPITPETPPGMWSRHITNSMPYLGAHTVIFNLDEANATFALHDQLPQRQRVTIVWLPDVDTHSHHMARGQFGKVRRTLARCDQWIGRCIEQLKRDGRLEKTYLMVVSDHGHTGGRYERLNRYDLAHELFYQPRLMTRQKQWVGGGLGLSIRQQREWHRHSKDNRREFVFLEAGATGCARIFLPKGHYRSGQWMGGNSISELFRYRLDEHLPPINLVDHITKAHVGTRDNPQFPIDLVLAKIGHDATLVASGKRGWAVIERKVSAKETYQYRYQVIKSYGFNPSGDFLWHPHPNPQTDPLRLMENVSPEFLAAYHDEATWLDVTVRSPYPDSVVALSRHMLWSDKIKPREQEYAPDLVVTAAPGWRFGEENEPGTSHGHPLRDTMLNTWLLAGPNVRRGAVVERPCRAVDVLPTILEMAEVSFEPEEMDGRPLRLIYEAPNSEKERYPVDLVKNPTSSLTGHAVVDSNIHRVYWNDVDLEAWKPVHYSPRAEYPLDWAPVHRYDNPWDLHNLFS